MVSLIRLLNAEVLMCIYVETKIMKNTKSFWIDFSVYVKYVLVSRSGVHAEGAKLRLLNGIHVFIPERIAYQEQEAPTRLRSGSHETSPIMWLGEPAPPIQCWLRGER
jgi:hypothetical protein